MKILLYLILLFIKVNVMSFGYVKFHRIIMLKESSLQNKSDKEYIFMVIHNEIYPRTFLNSIYLFRNKVGAVKLWRYYDELV